MKGFIRILLFILSFQLEVRVRAAGEIQQPEGCLKSTKFCAVKAAETSFNVEGPEGVVRFTAGSSVVRLSANRWRLLAGQVWVEKGPEVVIETLYGDVHATQGQFWVLDQGERVLVRNINSNVSVNLRDGKSLNPPEGFEFWLSGLNSSGVSDFGMIQPIDLAAHLPLWNQLFKGSKEEFAREARNLKDNWGDLTEKSSRIYRGVVDRQIASEKAEQRKVALKKAADEAQYQQMKKLYYQKVFER